MTVEQKIKKAKVILGYVCISEDDGMYMEINKKDLLQQLNTTDHKPDIDKFELDEQKNLWIN
jgi:hypothetical protein